MMRSHSFLQRLAALALVFASPTQGVLAAEPVTKLPACDNTAPEFLLPPRLTVLPPPSLARLSSLPRLPALPVSSAGFSRDRIQVKAKLLAAIAQQYAVAGQLDEAQATFAEAVKLARTLLPLPYTATPRVEDANYSRQINLSLALIEAATHRELERETKQMLLETLPRARKIRDSERKSNVLDKIARQFAQFNQIETAQQIAQGIPVQAVRLRTLRQLAVQAAANGQWQTARQIIETINEGTNNDFNYEWQQLAIRLTQQGHLDRGLAAVKELPANSQSYRLEDMAKVLAQKQQFADAHQTAIAIVNPTVKLHALLQLAELARRDERAADHAQALAAALETVQGLEEATAQTYVFDRTRAQTYNLVQIANQFIAVNQIDRALPLLTEALPLAQAESSCQRRVKHLQAVARAYAAAGQRQLAGTVLAQALDAAQQLKSGAFKQQMLVDLGGTTLKHGDSQQAETLFAEALKIGTPRDRTRNVSAIRQRNRLPLIQRSIAIYYAEVGETRLALARLDRAIEGQPLLSSGYADATLRGIFTALMNNGKTDDAIAVIRRMERFTDRQWAIDELNRQAGSPQVLAQTLPMLAIIENPRFRRSVVSSLAMNLARAGQFEGALQTLQAMPNSEDRVLLVRQIALLAAKQGNRSATLRAVYRLPTKGAQDKTLSEAIVHLANREEVDRLLPLARTIQASSSKDKALNAIATQLAKDGLFSEAIALVDGLVNRTAKVETLSAIATQLLEAGETDRALALLAEAKTTATAIKTQFRPPPLRRAPGRLTPPSPSDRGYPSPSR